MNHASSRIWAPVFLWVALLLALLVVKPLYSEYIDKSSTLALLVKQTEKTKSEYDALLKIKEKTASGTSDDLSLRVKKLGKKWNTSDVMEIVMLSDFTRPTVGQWARISISSIAVDEWTKLPNGLSLGKVNVTISGTNLEDIIDYITFLSTSAPYAFTIDKISLPIEAPDDSTPVSGYTLALDLGVYHYE